MADQTLKHYKISQESNSYVLYRGSNSSNVELRDSKFDTIWDFVVNDMGSDLPVLVEFGPGQFNTRNGIALIRSNYCIRGSGKGITTIALTTNAPDETTIMGCFPTATATAYLLQSNATAGDLTLALDSGDAANLTSLDYIILRSDLAIDTEFSTRKQGELHRVKSVSGGTVTLSASNDGTHVYESYATSNNAAVDKLTMYHNITIEDLTVTDLDTSRGGGLNHGQTSWRYVRNLTIKNCQFRNMFYSAVQLWQTWDTMIAGCEFRDIKDISTSANTFYGVEIRGASINTTVTNCTFDNMRHGVTQGAGGSDVLAGRTRNITVTGNTFRGTYASHIDCHQGADGVTFSSNTCIGDDGSANAIQARSPATIIGNSIFGVLGKGIYLFGNASNSVVTGNYINGCTSGIYVGSSTESVRKLTITGNEIVGTGSGYPIHFTASATVHSGDSSIISGNNIHDNAVTSYGVVLDSCSNVMVSSNYIQASTASRILSTHTDGTSNTIIGNYCVGLGGTPFQAFSSSSTHILKDNFGYNMKGASGASVSTPYPNTTGNVQNYAASGGLSFPSSGVVYTNVHSPKIFTIYNGGATLSAIDINGIRVSGTSGSFYLQIGETIKVTHTSAPSSSVIIA